QQFRPFADITAWVGCWVISELTPRVAPTASCPLCSESDLISPLQQDDAMDVGRLRETTLRRSPLRYASDWRQDIDTPPAALRMTSSTTSGFDNMGTCEDATSVVVAFMRFDTKRCRSGGTVRSWVARTYQLGLAFHAVPSTFWLKRSATGAACVAYTSFCSASGRSPAKCLTPLCLSQMRPSGTSRWSNKGDVGNLPSRLCEVSSASGASAAI